MRNYIIIISTFVLLTSCANLVPLSSSMITKNNWSKEDMKKIQYYVSNEVRLQKISSNSGTNISGGVITQESNKAVEEVIVKENTKGVAVGFPTDNIGISFEKDDNHFLTFGANPDRNGFFVLMASEWKDKIGKVTYNGEKYFTSPESKEVVLLVNLKKIKKLKISQRAAEGREVR
jgi:hypothetical protein